MDRLSLAQQIAQLKDVAPIDFDPEDVQVTGTARDLDIDIAAENDAARAHYFDVGPSSLRRPHESLSDPKYEGSKTLRKLIINGSDDSESNLDTASEDVESDGHALELLPEPRSFDRETGTKREADTRTSVGASTRRPTSKQNSDHSSNLHKTREEDRTKGKAISRQLALWDSLLDARIRLQKSVVAGNRLSPLPQVTANQQLHTSLVKMLEEARLLSNEIFDLQEHLMTVNESIQLPPRKRRKRTEIDYAVADYAEGLREASHAISEVERTYHPYLIQTLSKWSSKIQAVAPSVLLPTNRSAFLKTTQHIKSAPQLIDETLVDHGKVLARTRIYRGKGSRLGIITVDDDGAQEREDPEVFDDTDFYHQLLRDIIDTRGNGTSGHGDWMAVQKQNKAKKKVDTKASKGRKLRYEVHERIQNFMVPVPTQGNWHEEQIDELFASLLGKGFESAMQEVGETAGESLQEEVNGALQGGFRIFG